MDDTMVPPCWNIDAVTRRRRRPLDIENTRHANNIYAINLRSKSLTVILILLSGCNTTYGKRDIYNINAFQRTRDLGCFIQPNRIRHGSSYYGDIPVASLASTKEEYYDTLQDDLVQQRRSKRRAGLAQLKVHKKKRNKHLWQLKN
jgi:hypothetical protein